MSLCECLGDESCDRCTPQLNITPGLDSLPRQVAGFAEFRSRMLKQVMAEAALDAWRPCGQQDFGVMLLEMWAYIADVQSFYDQVIANECYLRTAVRRPSLRKLVDLLGYVPRPAVAATASVAVLAEGRRAIELPRGLGFRSTAFGDEASQVFELDRDSTIHPLHSKWSVAPQARNSLSASGSATAIGLAKVLLPADTALKPEDVVFIRVAAAPDSYKQVRTVASIEDYSDGLGNKYKQATFNTALSLRGDFAPSAVKLSRATQTGGLWTQGHVSGDPKAISNKQIVLDGLYRNLRAGQYLVLERAGVYKWFQVTAVKDVSMTLSAATTKTVKDGEGNNVAVAIPAVTAPATRLTLNLTVETGSWTDSHTDKMTLHYALQSAGSMLLAPGAAIGPSNGAAGSNSIALGSPLEHPPDAPPLSRVQLKDRNDSGAEVGAAIDYGAKTLTLDQGAAMPQLSLPVTAYGNVVSLSRGESVSETLGSGDPTLANQFFSLKKKPLTYLNAPTSDNEAGVVSTLTVYVDGVAWREVDYLYGIGPEERVYYLRQDDEGYTRVHFGDGVSGARLPSGAGNVTALYRFGAGLAAPPAGAINQLAKPLKGLTAVLNTVAASIGADAEPAGEIRQLAPRSALLLGRAISIEDIQVAASRVAGVEAAHAEWRWQEARQRPGVQVWYLGDEAIRPQLHEKLRLLTDENTAIAVDVVQKVALGLVLDIEIDERYPESAVLDGIYALLMDADDGLLQPANMGFAGPLFRSVLFETVLSVPGAVSVRAVSVVFWGVQYPWNFPALSPLAGYVWDFTQGGVSLNGESYG